MSISNTISVLHIHDVMQPQATAGVPSTKGAKSFSNDEAMALHAVTFHGTIGPRLGDIDCDRSIIKGDIYCRQNQLRINRSQVFGTVYCSGSTFRVGDGTHIERIDMRATNHDIRSPADAQYKQPVARRQLRQYAAGSHGMFAGRENIARQPMPFTRAAANRQLLDDMRTLHELQIIFLGAGAMVGHINFAAPRCRVILGPRAVYSGERPAGMEVVREPREYPSTARALQFLLNMRGAEHVPAGMSPVELPVPANIQDITLPDEADFSSLAQDKRKEALNMLFAPSTINHSARHTKVGEIGQHYIDALDGDQADDVISKLNSMDRDTKAKALAAILYGSYLAFGLEVESPQGQRLKDVFNGAKDLAGDVKKHMEAIEGSGLDAVGHGTIKLLNMPAGRRPGATNMLLGALGIG